MATTGCLSDNCDPSRLHIHGEEMICGCADDGISGRGGDGVNHLLSRNTLAEFLKHRWGKTPLLDPVFRQSYVRNGDGAATLRSVHEGDGARCSTANRRGARAAGNDSGIQHNPREVMESGAKKMCLTSACSAIDVALGVDVERGDAALLERDRGRHAGQAGGKCDHRTLADKLVREVVQIGFD